MSRYFIDRPIFAWVIAIVMMLAGIFATRGLSIAQYPDIAPPAIAMTVIYPGADAQTLENTTTQIIEQQMKGIDHLRYLSSTSDSSGTATITLTFEQGTNPDTAQVQVQNKLQVAVPLLPQEVQQQGIRVAGVGDTQILGAQYAMRIRLDPIKLANLNIAVSDVKAAILAQDAQVSAGQISGLPAPPGQAFSPVVTAQSRLQTADQFAAILLRTSRDGSSVKLGDVARIAIGAETDSFVSRYDGHPAAGMIFKLAPGANALTTVANIKAEMSKLSATFPSDMQIDYPVDNAPFVKLSIEQVIHTLIEAIILVFVVMFVFLQNWRATLIPTIAVPAVLLGSGVAPGQLRLSRRSRSSTQGAIKPICVTQKQAATSRLRNMRRRFRQDLMRWPIVWRAVARSRSNLKRKHGSGTRVRGAMCCLRHGSRPE